MAKKGIRVTESNYLKGPSRTGREPPHSREMSLEYSPFVAGNKYAAAENMSPAAHSRRMAALYRGWATNTRKGRGERVMPAEVKKKIVRAQRSRLRENVAREVREIQDMARKLAGNAIEVMAEIMHNEEAPEAARIAASQVILERAYGKATQTNVNAVIDANGKPSEVTAKELDSRVAETLKRIESITGGAAEAAKGEDGSPDLRKHDRDPGGSSVH